jgi:alkylation response protein AidB-like acyl-CoA dehydrogenase
MVSFDLTDEQKMIRETVAAFAAGEVRPAAREADETGAIPPEVIAKSWELGLVAGAIPEQFGGYGDTRSAVTGALVAEELAFGDLSIALHALAPRLLAFPIIEMGTDEQRERYLKPLAAGEFTAAGAAMIEPRFDFDPAAMGAIARADGGEFVLNGIKCNAPLAASAGAILIYAATNPEAGFAGIDAFIVPRDARGLTISEREKNMGIKGLDTRELTLADCRVPAVAKLGGDNGVSFTRILSQSRVAMAAMAVGVARAAFEYARAYAKERKAFGVPIATKQAVAFMLAEMAIEIDASRLLVWEAASRLDKGDDAMKESYQAKNYAASASLMVADNAVQVLGGHGYIREHPVEMFLRNARGFAVLDGLAIV